jgi:hypothetical protein
MTSTPPFDTDGVGSTSSSSSRRSGTLTRSNVSSSKPCTRRSKASALTKAMVSTARFQSGALEFAKVHGIALVSVTEGRFTFETRAMGSAPVLSREQALAEFGTPTFVGFCYGPGATPESTSVTLISTEYPEYIRELLLAVPVREPTE